MNVVLLFLVLLGAIGLTALAQRKGLQPALVIVVVGFAVSFIPGIPRLDVPSELILGVVLPPLLYSAALNFSFFSFIRNFRPIILLGVSLVIVTAIVVGFVASWIVPALTIGTAILLGAVVAPPDAVTAVAIGNKLGLPRRVMDVLTGESLVNDAAALTLFTITVSAVAGTHTLFANPVLLFLYSAVVGALLGLVLGLVTNFLRRYLKNAGLETVLGIMLPFAAYFIAEQIEASGVLAVVFAGFAVGAANDRVNFETRLQEKPVWASFDVLLEAFVFTYMGLQLRFVIDDVAAAGLSVPLAFGVGGVVLVLVMVIRPIFVFGMVGQDRLGLRRRARRKEWEAAKPKLRARRNRQERGKSRPAARAPMTIAEATVISWTGMRGVVTIAAAAGIPLTTAAGDDFPGRPLIQAVAFTVAVGTLLIQGATLPALIRRVRLPGDEVERHAETKKANVVVRRAAKAVLVSFSENPPSTVDADTLKHVLAAAQERADSAMEVSLADDEARSRFSELFDELLASVLQAQRLALIEERDGGRLDNEAALRMIERLDLQEAAVASRQANRL